MEGLPIKVFENSRSYTLIKSFFNGQPISSSIWDGCDILIQLQAEMLAFIL